MLRKEEKKSHKKFNNYEVEEIIKSHTTRYNPIQHRASSELRTPPSIAGDPELISWRKPGGDDKCEGRPFNSGGFSGDNDISGGCASVIGAPVFPDFIAGFLPKISFGNSTLETPKIATGF